jgi:TPR repeat protein
MRLFRELAERNALAQVSIGHMYQNGQGAPQDYTQAMFWYRKAADQRDDQGQFDAGMLYAHRLGVPQDYK